MNNKKIIMFEVNKYCKSCEIQIIQHSFKFHFSGLVLAKMCNHRDS